MEDSEEEVNMPESSESSDEENVMSAILADEDMNHRTPVPSRYPPSPSPLRAEDERDTAG